MKQFEFSTLAMFLEVAESGSFSKAARKVHLAVAAVSTRIGDFERSVGTPLFYRHARGVRLTPAGHTMARHAREILFGVDRMRAEISEFSRGTQGHVRIGANTSAITEYLPEELGGFLARHPRLKIELEEMLSDDIIRSVAEGRRDLGIFSATAGHGELATFPYHVDQLCLITPSRHPLARRRSVAFQDAQEYEFIGLEQGSSLLNLLVAKADGALRLRVQVRSFDAMCRMVQAGIGVGVLPEQSARPHVRSMRIRAVPLTDTWAQRELLLGVRSVDALTVAARSLLEHLTSHTPGSFQRG